MVLLGKELWEIPLSHTYYRFDADKDEFEMSCAEYKNWSLCLTEKGSFFFNIQDCKGLCQTYDILICPPGHKFLRNVMSNINLHFFHLHFGNEYTIQQDVEGIPYGKMCIADTQRLTSTLNRLRPLSGKNGDYQYQYRNHLLNDIWQIILSEYLLIEDSVFDSDDVVLSKALGYIRQFAYGKLSLEHVADYVNTSPSQLTRKFKRVFSVAPIEYVTGLRLQKAKKLLHNPGMKLCQIAQSCGFDNEYYFSRVFKKHEGIPPSEYKKRL